MGRRLGQVEISGVLKFTIIGPRVQAVRSESGDEIALVETATVRRRHEIRGDA
jgi:hypothetical protein